MKVALAWPPTEWELSVVRSALEVPVELVYPKGRAEIGEVLEDAEFAIVGFVDERHVLRARALRVIHFVGAGIDHLPLKAIREKGITLTTGKGTNARGVAELAMALILAIYRRVVEHDRILKSGGWVHFREEELEEELEGKVLAILGFGSIGRELARMARAFGMRVMAIKRTPEWGLEERYGLDFVGGPEDLLRVLREADVVVIAMPLTRETEGMIGRRELMTMKRGSVLINVGRGRIVDEAALKEALESGHLRAAGLDVWWTYPPEDGFPSRKGIHLLQNVVAHSHKGGWTRQARERALRLAAENVNRYYRGEPLVNVVDLERGY